MVLKNLFRRYKPWWEYIIVHHSWSKDHDTLDWQGIRTYHTSYRIDGHIVSKKEFHRRKIIGEGQRFETPWADIGYHYGIEKISGRYEILVGRALTETGAHCKGMNRKSLGVCFIGNYDKTTPTDEMLVYAATYLFIPLLKISNQSVDIIQPHSRYSVKSCPGKKFDLDEFKKLVDSRL